MLPLGLMFFFILFSYTILRDTKDVLVVTAPKSGAEIIPFLKTCPSHGPPTSRSECCCCLTRRVGDRTQVRQPAGSNRLHRALLFAHEQVLS